MRSTSLLFAVVVSASAVGCGFVASSTPVGASEPHEFVGSAKCGTCHKKDDIGNQLGKWAKTGHANAMETLSTAQAKEWATEAGVADPTTDGKCVKCHTTAYGVSDDLKGSKFTHTEGVSCESCHGAGSDYKKKSVMVDRDESKAKGLVIPTEKVCTKCHNDESPAWDPTRYGSSGFDFKKASKKIAHPVPAGYDPYADDE